MNIDELIAACSEQRTQNVEQSLDYGKEALRKAMMYKDEKKEALAAQRLANTYMYKGDLSAAEKMILRSIRLFKRQGNTDALARSLRTLSNIYLWQGKMVEAFSAMIEAQQIWGAMPEPTTQFMIEQHYASMYEAIGDYSRAIAYVTSALSLAEQLQMPQYRPPLLILLVNMLQKTKKLQEAWEYVEVAIQESRENHDFHHCAVATYSACNIAIELQLWNKLEALLADFKTLCNSTEGESHIHRYYLCMAELQKHREQFQVAIDNLEDILQPVIQSHDTPLVVDVTLKLLQCYVQEKLHQKAYTFAVSMIPILTNLGDIHSLGNIMEEVAKILHQEGQFEQASEYWQKALELYRQEEKEVNKKSVELYEIRLEIERKMLAMKADADTLSRSQQEIERLSKILAAVSLQQYSAPQQLIGNGNKGGHEQVWEVFEREFLRSNPFFLQQLSVKHVSLTAMEHKIAMLIRSNLSNKDIASMLFLSVRTVEFHRRNIRQKLGIATHENLYDYLHKIG